MDAATLDSFAHAILGTAMVRDGAASKLLAKLEPSHFRRPDHRRVFAALREMQSEGVPIDATTLAGRLGTKHRPFIAELLDHQLPRNTALDHY